MIKILFFIETLKAGGAEKVLCDLVNNMDQSKFAITVQTVWKQDPGKYLVPGIRYKYMYEAQNAMNRVRYRAEAAAGLSYRLHIKDNYDIECAYLEMGPTKIMSQSTNKKAIKLAWVHCDLKQAVSDIPEFVKKTTPWYAVFDQIVCVSNSAKTSFDEIFHHRFKSTALYNVVNDESIHNKAEKEMNFDLKHRKFTILSVGRFVAPKNYKRLLKVHKRLLEEGIDHDLWIMGDGPERPMLEEYIRENDLECSVFMPGFAENPYPYMREADLLVCSSNYEGFSTFMTEGLILGKPIVSTAVSGTFELFGDSEYGLVTNNDDEDFYLGVKRMATSAELREEYTEKAVCRGQEFSTERLVRETEKFLMDRVELYKDK